MLEDHHLIHRKIITYPFCITASRLRQTYSRAASLNSATELGATAVSSEQTLRALTAYLLAFVFDMRMHALTVTTDKSLTDLRKAIEHQLVRNRHDVHNVV